MVGAVVVAAAVVVVTAVELEPLLPLLDVGDDEAAVDVVDAGVLVVVVEVSALLMLPVLPPGPQPARSRAVPMTAPLAADREKSFATAVPPLCSRSRDGGTVRGMLALGQCDVLERSVGMPDG